MIISPEMPGQNPDSRPHIKLRVTTADLPMAFPHDQVRAILALGGRFIDPFETLKAFEVFKEYPLSEEHMIMLNPRLSLDTHLELRQTRKGLRMPAERYCRFLLAVAETVPGSDKEIWKQLVENA
jgi:hypothetical protein